MTLLLASATHFEIGATTAWIESHYEGLNTLKAKLLITGIGQLQTGYRLTNRIGLERPALVIQAGIGGSHSPDDIGKVFAIGSDRLADLGLMEKKGFSNIYEMGLEPADRYPFKNGHLINPYQSLLEWTGLPGANGMTVNEIKSDDLNSSQKNEWQTSYHEQLNEKKRDDLHGSQRNELPVVESMEGAALHYVCLMEKIPFLQIRAISNVIGDRNKERWQIQQSLKNLNEVLITLIQKLEKADETLFRL